MKQTFSDEETVLINLRRLGNLRIKIVVAFPALSA
jgi:hypothetical protein